MSTLRITKARFPRAPPARHAAGDLATLGDWLGTFSWNAWATFTWGPRFGPSGPSGDRALYHFRGWVSGLPGHDTCYFAAVESGSLGRTHLHALLRFPEFHDGRARFPRKAAWRSWFNRYGRCQIREYVAEKGARYYVTKYLVKAPELWDIHYG